MNPLLPGAEEQRRGDPQNAIKYPLLRNRDTYAVEEASVAAPVAVDRAGLMGLGTSRRR